VGNAGSGGNNCRRMALLGWRFIFFAGWDRKISGLIPRLAGKFIPSGDLRTSEPVSGEFFFFSITPFFLDAGNEWSAARLQR